MVKKKVGAGGDFADWRDAYVYLATVDPLTDDYEFEQISDCTINNNWPGDGTANNIDLNEHYVKFYCPHSLSHHGDPTRGLVTYVNGAAGFIRLLAKNTPIWPLPAADKFIVENLYIKQTTNNDVILLKIGNEFINCTMAINIKNLLIKGFTSNSATGFACLSPQGADIFAENLKIWNCKNGYSMQSSSGVATLHWHYLENSVIYNCLVAIYTGGTAVSLSDSYEVKNCFLYSTTPLGTIPRVFFYNSACVGTIISASNAALKSNCLENRVATDEFQSVDDTNSAFLSLKQGSINLSASRNPSGVLQTDQKCKFTPALSFLPGTCTIGVAGIAPSYAGNMDIAGKSRPGGDDLYSIGCHEQQYV